MHTELLGNFSEVGMKIWPILAIWPCSQGGVVAMGPKSRLDPTSDSYQVSPMFSGAFAQYSHLTASCDRPGQRLSMDVVYGGCVFICVVLFFVC